MRGAFGSQALERQYSRWRRSLASATTRALLIGVAVAAGCNAVVHAPQPSALKYAFVSLLATLLHVASWWKDTTFGRSRMLSASTVAVMIIATLIMLPGHDAALPAIFAIFGTYTLVALPLLMALPSMVLLSLVHIACFLLFVQPVKTMELLALLVVHAWTHFLGVYIHMSKDRIARDTFISGRNAVETEHVAEEQSQKLNRLLSAFLPSHLIMTTRHQIAQQTPQIFVEHYGQATVVYARITGLDAVLSQCSANDAAHVIKEFEQRIERLVSSSGCLRVPSDGIMVIAGIPEIDAENATRALGFACDLEALIASFRDATCANVTICIGIDSGPITAGVVGRAKWHYDVIGVPVDNAVLLQNNAPSDGIFITDDTQRCLKNEWSIERIADFWKIHPRGGCPSEMFPVNKRFSLVTLPQAVNRLLQTIAANDNTIGLKTLGALGAIKKRKEKLKESSHDSDVHHAGRSSMIKPLTLAFVNEHVEAEYHKEMDKWIIPALTISICFLIVHGLYHVLVMPRLITSIALIILALFFLTTFFVMLFANDTFSQFVTRSKSGHMLSLLLIMAILFMCGIVNTFSCPSEFTVGVCEKIHFSAFSFAIWIIWTTVFLRNRSIIMLLVLTVAILTYILQIFVIHTAPMGKQFETEADILISLCLLAYVVILHARESERLLRLDFLAHVKGVEETASRERFLFINSQVMLNLVPAHIVSAIAAKSGDLWQHTGHSVGVAYLAISGFDLHGEQGLNALNYIYGFFDQTLADFKGIEKVKSANRFYVVAAGLVPDAAQNVNETPWTVGELLYSLANYLLRITQFATEQRFDVQIGIDCGSVLSVVCDTEKPQYDLYGETVERARYLMQSASHEKLMASEEIYLALRPRHFNFSNVPIKISQNLHAYLLRAREDDNTVSPVENIDSTSPTYEQVAPISSRVVSPVMSKNAEEKHTMKLFQNAQQHNNWNDQSEMFSSMCSSFSSDLHSIDAGGETDSDIEWVNPEHRLIKPHCVRPLPPLFAPPGFKPDPTFMYSDNSDMESSRNPSRMSNASNSRFSYASKGSRRRWRRNPGQSLSNMRRGNSSMSTDGEIAELVSAGDRLEAAANRVELMLKELNAYGDFAAAPLGATECAPFPMQMGSIKSIDADRAAFQKRGVLSRAVSSAAHTEYDNAESEQALSEAESRAPSRSSRKMQAKQKRKRWFSRTKRERDGSDADMESQCSSMASSVELDPLRWKSVHSIGYDNEYEIQSETEGLCVAEMQALSRDIRRNFGDYELAQFDDIDAD